MRGVRWSTKSVTISKDEELTSLKRPSDFSVFEKENIQVLS